MPRLSKYDAPVPNFGQPKKPRGARGLCCLSLGLILFSALATKSARAATLKFGAHTDYVTGRSPRMVALGDFNGDGNADMVLVNSLDNSVSILLGDGKGGFSAKTDFPTGLSPSAVVVGDFNRDGKLDMAVANVGPTNSVFSVSVFLGDGKGGFGTKTDFATGKEPESIAAGDFNGDGNLDLVLSNEADSTGQCPAGQRQRRLRGQDRFRHRRGSRIGGRRRLERRRPPRHRCYRCD